MTLCLMQSCRFQTETVDVIVHNATIYQVDDAFSKAEAMAIKDGRIVAIGPEREIMNAYDAVKIVDAEKRAVYPGFIDAHCHFLAFALGKQDAQLYGAASNDAVIDLMIKYAPQRSSEWVLGRGWDQNNWKQSYAATIQWSGSLDSLIVPMPDRTKLDSLFPTTPVYLTRIDGHSALANGEALRRANINESTTVKGGEVVVINGKCTGLLIDNAMSLVERIIPDRTRGEKAEAMLKWQHECFKEGLTTLDEAGLLRPDVELIDSLQGIGQLKMRIYAMLSDDSLNYEYYLKKGIDTTSEKLTVRSFKFYADGALGSRGACLLSPYEDILQKYRRKEYGLMLKDEDYFRTRANQLLAGGWQMNTHAIGDSANRVILRLYGSMLQGSNDHRWRIEHAQVVSAKDVALFKEHTIIPSVQPVHATSDMMWAWERLGRSRVARAYAYKELKEQNGLVALGTDFPVEEVSTKATYCSAVFRRNAQGLPDGGFQMENSLTREETLRGMTLWAAIANKEESKKGSLEVGKYADFVIVDIDWIKAEEDAIRKSRVLATYIAGEEVYTVRR